MWRCLQVVDQFYLWLSFCFHDNVEMVPTRWPGFISNHRRPSFGPFICILENIRGPEQQRDKWGFIQQLVHKYFGSNQSFKTDPEVPTQWIFNKDLFRCFSWEHLGEAALCSPSYLPNASSKVYVVSQGFPQKVHVMAESYRWNSGRKIHLFLSWDGVSTGTMGNSCGVQKVNQWVGAIAGHKKTKE